MHIYLILFGKFLMLEKLKQKNLQKRYLIWNRRPSFSEGQFRGCVLFGPKAH